MKKFPSQILGLLVSLACSSLLIEGHTLNCRRCGLPISTTEATVTAKLDSKYGSFSYIHPRLQQRIQVLTNPSKREFEVLCVQDAVATAHPEKHMEHSWSSAHTWSFLTCPRCKAHLGWHFERLHHCNDGDFSCPLATFQGLIMDALVVDDARLSYNTSVHVPRLHRM
eukprot:TRINITY_DN4511_c0_g1_i1.p1 TRINITY_DN4511_c0_g1~~TRINITY_DN4511_c0_g1_i1.p1  ORF type:complete len:168 (+),score=8.91 TRINITY_DN4511_c0_g1_i1:124-627(+)